ncbi:MAG: helix-hairpin-helix domain-containing protein [Solirubrobacterales bacterium]
MTERATAEILALEVDLERERESAAKTLEEVQRGLEEAEARAVGNVSVTDTRTREEPAGRQREQRRLQRPVGELLDPEMRRLQAESDALIEEALSQVESNTRVRMQQEADRRLAEREEELRAAAETRVRAAGETARKRAEAQFQEEIETARLDAEAEARTAAAEWIRSQTRALQREAERTFAERERRPEPEPDQAENKTPEKDAVQPEEPKLGFLQRRAEARRARREEKTAATKKESQSSGTAKVSIAKTPSRAKSSSASKATGRRGDPVDVNKATVEEFRELGMSITQATRVVAYRERHDGFDSVDELDGVPGVSEKLMTELRDQLTA